MLSNPLHVHHLCEGLIWLAIASTASCVRLVAGVGGSELRPPFCNPTGTVSLYPVSYCVANSSKLITTFSDGCLGSNNDEGRSEMR